MSRLKIFASYRRALILGVTPFVSALIPIITAAKAPEKWREANCAFGLIVMAVYWTTEVIPLSVTALFPVFIFPLLNVASAKVLCMQYLKDTNMMFVGGLVVAVAVEHWNLHKRIALKILTLVGSKPRWLMLGFMLPTWFLSMWISNTATTAMMIPIAQAVINQLKQPKKGIDNEVISDKNEDVDQSDITLNGIKSETSVPNGVGNTDEENFKEGKQEENLKEDKLIIEEEEDEEWKRLCKGMSLCVAYAATTGGIATLTGTGPNLIMKDDVDEYYDHHNDTSGLSFGTWMAFGLPTSAITLIIAWFWLQFMFIGFGKSKNVNDEGVKAVIKKEYDSLGPMSFAEKSVLAHFVILALLWLTREPEFIPGWADLFHDKYIVDAVPAVFIACMLFIFPSEKPHFTNERTVVPLLKWKTVAQMFPWHIVLLLGGGFALAEACKVSGLSALVGTALKVFEGLHPVVLVLCLCAIVALLTEVTSNVAIASLFLPIIISLAVEIRIHPLYLAFPCALSTSFAFMLPVATPPNAIVFSYGHIRVIDMVKAGVGMNIICLGVVTLAINTWGKAIFNLDTLPSWMTNPQSANITTAMANITVGPHN